jgi:hypothetical protein
MYGVELCDIVRLSLALFQNRTVINHGHLDIFPSGAYVLDTPEGLGVRQLKSGTTK